MSHPALTPSMTIDGRPATSGPTTPVIDPATEEVFARAPAATRVQLDEAIAAAARAFPAWGRTPVAERQRAVAALGERIRDHADELALLLTREQGKPLAKSRSEIASAVNYIFAYAKMDIAVEVIRDTAEQRVELHRRPLGVVAAITAWNYPILLAAWKLGPALIAGNTVVMKPSPFTPLTTLRIGELARDLLPAGVFNVVGGGNDVGQWLVEHPVVRKIAFTGSAATGKRIMAAAAGTLKRLTLELGGNDAGIVLDDVDPAAVAPDLFWAKFSNIGQVCAALKRLFVHERVHDRVCVELGAVAGTVKIGRGTEDGVDLGPLNNAMQLEKVRAAVDDALGKGAKILFQGKVPSGPGYFYPITLVTGVREGMRLYDEELFGPVLGISRFSDVEEALARANATEYGLGGSVWTRDVARGAALAARLESGSQWVNQHPSMGPDIPFGGVKGSGLGVECALPGLLEYTAIQVLNIRKR
jgi:acyl-CoA reductase-like NAD-dependent aldehyde dehydrogenase